ncbi:uncharacterized protein LOC111435769 [Cucurbita moschata]|uniref:Uncharacterized protein LOC111435769 n=1 Tax=Cucurbita moschata TaxID=3662 RepID=A0A6J1ELR2_CUCMO|nr:uncharacterized protein LOC111435769 [Cucurbita moschata]
MEGLIPMFYRAMKKTRIRSQYSVLSPEAAAAPSPSFNIADFYVDPPSTHVFPTSKSEDPGATRAHRRYNSFGGSTPEEWRRTTSAAAAAKSSHGPQLVRFRSQRILSCLTGQ